MSRWSIGEWCVRVGDGVEKTIVFVGRAAPTGEFIPYGTGFLVSSLQDDRSYQSIVTARHVIDLIQGTDEILLRINTHSGTAKTIITQRKWWFSRNPNIDLAFCPALVNPTVFDILHIAVDGDNNNIVNDDTIKQHDFGLGEDVFICGMYLSRIGENRNLPIIRSGVLSAMPSEMVRTEYGYHHVYLIEARSTGGLSGSPVFLQVPPVRFANETVKWSAGMFPQYFLGMVLGHNKLSHPPELIKFLPPDLRDPEEKADDEYERSVPLNTGIAVVLPATYIIEAVTDPWIMQMRKDASDRARKREGYVSDAAIHVAGGETAPDSKSEANPDHREDFNRLVGAASKPKPKGGRT